MTSAAEVAVARVDATEHGSNEQPLRLEGAASSHVGIPGVTRS